MMIEQLHEMEAARQAAKREAFLLELNKLGLVFENQKFDDANSRFENVRLNVAWHVWQAAQQSLLASIYQSKVVCAIESAVQDQVEASGVTGELHRLDGEKIINVIVDTLHFSKESCWIDVENELPQPFLNVLVKVDSPMESQSQMVAQFIPRYAKECHGCEDWDEIEFDEEKDAWFYPEGWYANTTYIGDEYSSYFLTEKVTHWISLPST